MDYSPSSRKRMSPSATLTIALGLAGCALLPLTYVTPPARSDTIGGTAGAGAAPTIAHGAAVAIGRKTVLVARPLDSNHTVTAVRFLLDGVTLAECGAPGRWTWDTQSLRPGRHVIQVQAFDNDQYIGLSEPLAVYIGQDATTSRLASTVEVPFFTYEVDPRRSAGIMPPKIDVHQMNGQIPEAGSLVASRLPDPVIEVYLNGVRQQFAPAARVASADELSSSANRAQQGRRGSHHAQQKSRMADRYLLGAKAADRTVWLPARPLLERLGARISWQAKGQVLVANLNIAGAPRRIMLSARRDHAAQAEIGGRRIALQTPVRLAENALMVPLSFCQDALDLRVRWQKSDGRVEMFTPITPA